MTAQTYIYRGRQKLSQWIAREDTKKLLKISASGAGGFLAGAASLGNAPIPLAMAGICALKGWEAAACALGALLGYRFFWGSAGYAGMVWAVAGWMLSFFLERREKNTSVFLLVGGLGSLVVAAVGLLFQILSLGELPFPIYILQVAFAFGAICLFGALSDSKESILLWLGEGAAMLALIQIAPVSWLSLGHLAAGFLASREVLPALALSGLAIDLANISPVPMTAVLSLAFFLRYLPKGEKRLRPLAAATAYLVVMLLVGRIDLKPLPGLAAGGLASVLMPMPVGSRIRRGETGKLQVRLELMAGVLSQTQQILLEIPKPGIDTQALLVKTRERACGGCPSRKQCGKITLPDDSLSRCYTDASDLGSLCRKPGRMILELRRSQEQYRKLQAEHIRLGQYRSALIQQYQFLAEYLREQADLLPQRVHGKLRRFQADVGVCTAGKEPENGDKCLNFPGINQSYYILICDGMGTGLGAAREGTSAARMLEAMLTAGFPAAYALRSLNSLCCLRGQAGAVTLDLAQIQLDTGEVILYKWGAAPSWILRRSGVEKVGTAGPPPGISVEEAQESVQRLSLRRGEALILTSDGVQAEEVLHRLRIDPAEPPGEVASCLLEHGAREGTDDATVAVIRLRSTPLST